MDDTMEPKLHGSKKVEVAEKIESVPSNKDIELRSLDSGNSMKAKKNLIILGVYLLLIVMGVGTGYLLSGKSTVLGTANQNPGGMINTGKVVGSTDTTTFKDSAVGVIQKGGIDGEGTHQLIRPGGPSQTAYLFSSVIDLDQYIGKKVKVWGQTVAGQKASWLMDVGKIELQQ
jgi:hypothetical protein